MHGTSTTSATSTFLATYATSVAEVNLESLTDTEEFREEFFEAQINGDITYANLIRVLIMKGSEEFAEYIFEHGINYGMAMFSMDRSSPAIFALTVGKPEGKWPNLFYDQIVKYQQDAMSLLKKLAPIFKTEQAQIAALAKIEFIAGKIYRDDAFCFIEWSNQSRYDDYAVDHFAQAARYGSAHAFEALKDMFLNGRGLRTSPDLAAEILKAASPTNSELPDDTGNEAMNAFLMEVVKATPDIRATYYLAILYERYFQKNTYLIDEYCHEAALNEKNPDALCHIAEWYLVGDEGVEIKKDIELGELFLLKASNEGSERARTLLQELYFDGKGQYAFKYFSEGDAKGEAAATYGLAMLYALGLGGVAQDLETANKLFIKAADAGSSDALFKLAEFSLEENETIQNCAQTSLAGKYLQLAADKGCVKAAYLVGMNCLGQNGKSTSIWISSCNQAEKNFTIAHNNGYAAATYQLGVMQEKGLLGEADLTVSLFKSVRLFKQAAIAGDLDALCKFGELLMEGLKVGDSWIVDQNLGKAKECLGMAADLGHARAAYLLTKFYAPGPTHPSEYPGLGESDQLDDLCMKFYLFDEINGVAVDSQWFLPRKWYIPDNVARNDPGHYGWWTLLKNYSSDVKGLALICSKNQKKLYELLTIAANGGIADAQYRLGKFLQADMHTELNPSIVDMSYEKRESLITQCFAKAAAQGHELAMRELGEKLNG